MYRFGPKGNLEVYNDIVAVLDSKPRIALSMISLRADAAGSIGKGSFKAWKMVFIVFSLFSAR